MYIYKKLFKEAICFSCLFVVLALYPLRSIDPPRLYGKILVLPRSTKQGIYVPLNNLKIEILEVRIETHPDTKQVRIPGRSVKSIHPDSSGNFTFYLVREGTYFIRISMPIVELNQTRMIDLYQAEISVKYVNEKCDLSTINVPMPIVVSAQKLQIRAESISNKIGSNRWEWQIYIKAPKEITDNIDCVEYTLPPTFSQRIWKICRDRNFNARYPFSLAQPMQGREAFSVFIKVFFRDEKICVLDHMLVFASGTNREILAIEPMVDELEHS